MSEFAEEAEIPGAEAGGNAPLRGFLAAAGGGELAPGRRDAEPPGFLPGEPAGEKLLFDGGEPGEALHAKRTSGGSQGKRNDESKPVLNAAAAGFGDKPVPVEILEAEHEPGESLDDGLFKTVADKRSHQNNGGVVALLSLDFGKEREEARIAKGAEGVLDGAEAQIVGAGHGNNLAAGERLRLRRRAGVQ